MPEDLTQRPPSRVSCAPAAARRWSCTSAACSVTPATAVSATAATAPARARSAVAPGTASLRAAVPTTGCDWRWHLASSRPVKRNRPGCRLLEGDAGQPACAARLLRGRLMPRHRAHLDPDLVLFLVCAGLFAALVVGMILVFGWWD